MKNVRFITSVVILITTLITSVSAEPARPVSVQDQGDKAVFIHLQTGSFDPLEAELTLPQRLTYTAKENAQAGNYILQFNGPVMPAWKQAVLDAGGQLGGYLPDYAFVAHLDAAAYKQVQTLPFVRWVGAYHPAFKLSSGVDYADERSYRLILLPWADFDTVAAKLEQLAAQPRRYSQGFSAVLDGDKLDQIARMPGVMWVEPVYMRQLYNDVGGGDIMGGSTAWSNNYTGSGVTICVADTGLDTGNAGSIHQDFSGRVSNISSWPVVYANYGDGCEITNPGADDGASDTQSGHGSHVTGSVAGSGARSSGQIKGLAYEATITMQAIEQLTTLTPQCGASGNQAYLLAGIPDDVRDLLNEAYGWGARVHNNSWGGGEFGVYDTSASQFDDFVHSHPDMTIVTSAGNSGKDDNSDGYVDENSISSPATAKNLIVVGAADNERTTGGYSTYTWNDGWGSLFPTNPTRDDRISSSREELAAFSSRGPMADGRIKPDVSAPGTDILSVRSSLASEDGWGSYDSYYMYMGGTSMASPLTAGAAALVRDYYIDGEEHANPSAALIKATLINSAVDMSGYGNASQEAGLPIPNNHEGWGRVNVAAATAPGSRTFVEHTTGLDTGGSESYQHQVNAGQPFKVSLVWSDAAASASANPTLVNDLNLRLTAPDGSTQYWGNNFSGGWSQSGGSADAINNVENVYVQSPSAGVWTVEVIGQNVPQGPQPFALVVDGNLTVELSVTSIQPNSGPNNAILNGAVVRGTGFEAGSEVFLLHNAEVITGSNLVVDTGAGTITADFDLNGATVGMWDVRVTSASDSDTLEDAFTVIDSTLPDLAISKSAEQSNVAPGDMLTYTINIENNGSADATSVTFTDTLPGELTISSLNPACEGGTQLLPGGFACQIQGGELVANDSVEYTLVAQVSISAEGTLVNQVEVGSAQQDANTNDNKDQVSVTVGTGETTIYLPIVMRRWPPVPTAPSLSAISNADGDGNYTVSWTAGSGPSATSYDLEENSVVILTGLTNTSYSFSDKAVGAYTYRVRGSNSYGAGDWSAAQPVTVQPPSGPSPGFWEDVDSGGMEFYVTSDRSNVDDFAIYIYVDGCGNYKITHNTLESISNNSFSFSGSFYGSGTFSNPTTCNGSNGLDNFFIDGCGYVSGGPFNYTATWQHAASAASIIVSGPFTVERVEGDTNRFFQPVH